MARSDLNSRGLEGSPLTIFLDPAKRGKSLLIKTLDDRRASKLARPVAEGIGTCSIGTEGKSGGRVVATTIILFFKCNLSELWKWNLAERDRFSIEFGQRHKVGELVKAGGW